MREKPLTAIKKTNKHKKEKEKEKNRYNKKKKKKRNLGIVMVAILTEAFKLLHLTKYLKIANIK